MTIEEDFERFDREHPDVYQQFIEVAFDLWLRDIEHYSADAICHVIRWFRVTSGKDHSGFKINNNFTALYARKAIANYPQLEGFFRLRERRAA